MSRRAQSVSPDRIALLSERGLAQPAPVELDHLGPELVPAESRILVGVGSPQPVIHVQRRSGVPERTERVPQAGGVGAPGDEAADLAARLDQAVLPDVVLDPRPQRRRVHGGIVAYELKSGVTSHPCWPRPALAPASRSCTEWASRQALCMWTRPSWPRAVPATAFEYSTNIELRRARVACSVRSCGWVAPICAASSRACLTTTSGSTSPLTSASDQ